MLMFLKEQICVLCIQYVTKMYILGKIILPCTYSQVTHKQREKEEKTGLVSVWGNSNET